MYILRNNSCQSICTTTFFEYLNPTDSSVCVPVPLTNALPVFGGSNGLSSQANVQKCSILHTQSCSLQSWRDLSDCLTKSTTWMQANYESINASGWENLAPFFQSALSRTTTCLYSTYIGYGSECGSAYGKTDSICFVLSVTTPHSLASSCANDQKRYKPGTRCAKSSLNVIVFESLGSDPSPGTISCSLPSNNAYTTSYDSDTRGAFDVSKGSTCGGDIYQEAALGASCLALTYELCQSVDGGGDVCFELASTLLSPDLPSSFSLILGLTFGPDLLAQDLPLQFKRDAKSRTCSPWPLPYQPLDTNGVFLQSLVERLATHIQTHLTPNPTLWPYLLNASIDVSWRIGSNSINLAENTKVLLGSSPLASYWATTLLYCCDLICDTWATSLRASFAYSDKAEAIFCLLAIACYLMLFRREAQNLRMSITEILNRAQPGETKEGGREGDQEEPRVSSISRQGLRSGTLCLVRLGDLKWLSSLLRRR